jgi:hypothetical protein
MKVVYSLSNKVLTMFPWFYPLEEKNDWGPQFHPFTFGDHPWDRIWNIL